MLRPEQMSKVSVTGAKSVMSDVIETMHELHLVHITDYDGSWDGFEPGDSLEGADETSSMLVTVRSIESILDIDESDAEATTTVDLDNAARRLEEIRTTVNELDERRDELRNRRRELEERTDRMELFAELGIDLDLLWGYDTLDVLVGEGDPAAIADALEGSEEIDEFDVFGGGDGVAVFARTDDARLADELVGVPFTAYDVPERTGDPESIVTKLQGELEEIEREFEDVAGELDSLRDDSAGFLLALEEELTIKAQKCEAPLHFATTERSFVVEGWVPTGRYDELESRLQQAVDSRVDVTELKRAQHKEYGGHHEENVHDEPEVSAETGPDGESEQSQALTDGGRAEGELVTVEDDPPIIQSNSRLVKPFEVLVSAVNRPKYSEFDPTITLFVTLPLFFGFMISDVGYGLLYILIGWLLYDRASSSGVIKVGVVTAWLGIATAVGGVLYGEILGLHFFEWFGAHPPLEKGVTDPDWGLTWLVVAVLVGWMHLNVGYLFAFVEEYQLEGLKPALTETGSWLLMLNGLWVFIFSAVGQESKPAFLVGPEALLNTGPLGFGFAGFPELAGWIGVGMVVVGLALLLSGPWYDVFEVAVLLSHVLSYTRLTAVLIGKAGMALTVNLLYFGAYRDEDGFHYIHQGTPSGREAAGEDVVFGGLANIGTIDLPLGPAELGLEGAVLGLPVYIVGHAVVLAIGGTAAIQAVRLEYFEFFEKFYEGGGKNYEPFGHRRTHTTTN